MLVLLLVIVELGVRVKREVALVAWIGEHPREVPGLYMVSRRGSVKSNQLTNLNLCLI